MEWKEAVKKTCDIYWLLHNCMSFSCVNRYYIYRLLRIFDELPTSEKNTGDGYSMFIVPTMFFIEVSDYFEREYNVKVTIDGISPHDFIGRIHSNINHLAEIEVVNI